MQSQFGLKNGTFTQKMQFLAFSDNQVADTEKKQKFLSPNCAGLAKFPNCDLVCTNSIDFLQNVLFEQEVNSKSMQISQFWTSNILRPGS